MPDSTQDSTQQAPAGCCDAIVVVGRILAPYGIKGWVHVATFTAPKENLADYRPWMIAREGQTDWRPVTVREIRPHKQGFVALLVNATDRAAAERLRGSLIGVPEGVLPAAEADEYYWRDLVGASVTDPDGRVLGVVDGLMETGAHDVLVVKRADATELLIPFHARYVLVVDGGTICVDWPDEAGLESDPAP